MFLKSVVIRAQTWLLIATKTREFNTPPCSLTIYKITQIVRTLWLAERRVCMRVCKHACDVKMFCFTRANHAGTNLKKVLIWKIRRQVYSIYPFPRRLKLGKSLQTCCVNFFFAWAAILNAFFERHLFCKTRTGYAYKLRVQDFATGKNFSFNQCSKQESFAFFSGKLFHKSNRKLFFPVFAYPDINTRGVGGILDSNCLEFPQTLWCLFQAMQTQKMFSIAEMVIV